MIDKQDIQDALAALRNGDVILYPTDTVWGLGCDATNNDAVEKLRKLKGRAAGKAMLVLVDSVATLERYVDTVPDIAYDLIDSATEPLTVIFDKGKGFADGVQNEDGSIGIRVTSEAFSKELCRRFGKPIISTSANMAGEITPANFSQISENVKNSVAYVVASGQEDASEHMPSHIIKVSEGGVIKIIR
jgi:L-threonylcarbamoyladenylate synthase